MPLFGDGIKAAKLTAKAAKYADEVADAAGTAAKIAKNGCFVAGTPIHTKDGLKPIEDIRPGDMVWSRSEWNEGEATWRKVDDNFVLGDKEIWDVVIGTMDARTETFRATGNHPFWVEEDEDGWVAVELLQPGMTLRLGDGNAAHVVSTKNTHKMQPVFNFEVDGFHTYHVGELGAWVHNVNCGDVLNATRPSTKSVQLNKIYGQLWRDADKLPGGTAGQLLREIRSGAANPMHLQKAEERFSALRRLITNKNSGLSNLDRSGAQVVADQLKFGIDEFYALGRR